MVDFTNTALLRAGDPEAGGPLASVCRRMQEHASDWAMVIRLAEREGRLSGRRIREGMGITERTFQRWRDGADSPHPAARAKALRALQDLVRAGDTVSKPVRM